MAGEWGPRLHAWGVFDRHRPSRSCFQRTEWQVASRLTLLSSRAMSTSRLGDLKSIHAEDEANLLSDDNSHEPARAALCGWGALVT